MYVCILINMETHNYPQKHIHYTHINTAKANANKEYERKELAYKLCLQQCWHNLT